MKKKMGVERHGKAGRDSEHEGRAWGAGEFANMPQEKKMESYPKASHYGTHELDDSITGIDKCVSASESKANRFLSNQH